jgi:hypothetical protein
VASPKNVSTYSWDVDGATSSSRSFSYDYASDPTYEAGASHVIILVLTGPGGTTNKSKVVVAPC